LITITNVPKSVETTFYVPVYTSIYGGALMTSAAGLDSKISKDGGAFSDCVNELTEISTTGIYTLTLTATEMNATSICVLMSSSSATSMIVPLSILTTT